MLPPFPRRELEALSRTWWAYHRRMSSAVAARHALQRASHTTAIALEVILRAVIGLDRGERADPLARVLRKASDISVPQMRCGSGRSSGDSGRGSGQPRARETDELLYDENPPLRSDPALGERPTNVLSLLIREHGDSMSDKDLRATRHAPPGRSRDDRHRPGLGFERCPRIRAAVRLERASPVRRRLPRQPA